MDIVEKLIFLGFEVRSLPGQQHSEDSSVLQGTSLVPPGFGFVGAFKTTSLVMLNGKRHEGNFLVCCDPGTGNLVQVFDVEKRCCMGC